MDETFFAHVRAFMQSAKDAGVTIVPCSRCGTLCKIPAAPPSEDARIARYATKDTTKGGTCLACTFTGWLKSGPLAELITVEKLRDPRVQRHMAEMYDDASGKNDGSSGEINWDALITNWDLPSPKAKRKRRASRE